MTALVTSKTWQYNVNNKVVANVNNLNDHRSVLLGIVNAMLGFGSSPWTVSGSSNSTTSGMDATNRWSAVGNLIFVTTSGVHSWIVLRQTGVNAKFELCIDLLSSVGSNAANGGCAGMWISPGAGFGTTNGGTNGSTSTRPTATDEVSITSVTTDFLTGTTPTANARDMIYHVMQSTDGQCTRIFVRIPSSSLYTVMVVLDKPRNPSTGWTNTSYGSWFASSAGAPYIIQSFTTANLSARAPVGPMTLYMTCEAYGNYSAGYPREHSLWCQGPNQISGEIDLCAIGLTSQTTGAQGRHGRMFDIYWGPMYYLLETDTFPENGDRSWASFGQIVHPWNGTDVLLA